MDKADHEFMNELQLRRRTARIEQSHWTINLDDFKRGCYLGVLDWERVYLNCRTIKSLNLGSARFGSADLDNNLFETVDFRFARFYDAALQNTHFIDCNLIAANFNEANLSHVDFTGSNLMDCTFEGTNLRHVTGLKMITPVGCNGRNVYAYVDQGQIRIQAGCRNDEPDGIRAAVREDYADDPVNKADYLDAVTLLEKWGKRELKRVKTLG